MSNPFNFNGHSQKVRLLLFVNWMETRGKTKKKSENRVNLLNSLKVFDLIFIIQNNNFVLVRRQMVKTLALKSRNPDSNLQRIKFSRKWFFDNISRGRRHHHWKISQTHIASWFKLFEWTCIEGTVWRPSMVVLSRTQKSWPRFWIFWPCSTTLIMYILISRNYKHRCSKNDCSLCMDWRTADFSE